MAVGTAVPTQFGVAHPNAVMCIKMPAKICTKKKRRRVRQLLKRDGKCCQICGLHMLDNDRTLDHIQPVSYGGNHALTNLRLAHVLCNRKRGSKWL